jgi:RNA polymerase sigma factor (sigma-70 family)
MSQAESLVDNRAVLRRYIEAETSTLLATLRYYLLRAGLADGQGAALAAVELLNEVVVQALDHADRFRPTGQPMAWLLGIGANLIKRQQRERAIRNCREPLGRDLCPADQETLSEDELFDRLATLTGADPRQQLETDEQVAAILAHVSEADQRLLRLAIVYGLSGQELARALGVSPGAARVRLHRALNRLRATWPGQEQGRGENHG